MELSVFHRKKNFYQGLAKTTEKNLRSIIYQATNFVRTEAVKSIIQNPRRGPEVTRYGPKRTIRISAGGDAPASDTGNLVSLISSDVSPTGLTGTVRSDASYSKDLEYGTSKMAARPFLQPALEMARPLVRRKLRTLLRG